MSRITLGKTGRFPEGKKNEQDQGEIRFAIGISNDKVAINFGTQVVWVAMNPEQAEKVGRSLIENAQKIKHRLEKSQTNNNVCEDCQGEGVEWNCRENIPPLNEFTKCHSCGGTGADPNDN